MILLDVSQPGTACPYQNKTGYLIPGEVTAKVMLSPEHVGFFPVRTQKFLKTYQTEICTHYVTVKSELHNHTVVIKSMCINITELYSIPSYCNDISFYFMPSFCSCSK